MISYKDSYNIIMHRNPDCTFEDEKNQLRIIMKQGCATVYVIFAITIALVFLVKVIAGNDKKPSYYEEGASSGIISPASDTVSRSGKADSNRAVRQDKKEVSAAQPLQYGTHINIRNVAYNDGAYICRYTLSNNTSSATIYSVNYIIEERGPEGRFSEFKLLGSRDIGALNAGTGREFEFRIPDFERKSGNLYRVKIEAYVPGKNRGEPVEYQTSPI